LKNGGGRRFEFSLQSTKEGNLDREALDFSNDLVRVDPLVGECQHGKEWEKCEAEKCHKIWLMNQEQIGEVESQKSDWIYALKVRKRRGNKKSQYEIALEKARVSNPDNYEMKASDDSDKNQAEQKSSSKSFRNVFPDKITLQAALQFKALTERQRNVIKVYLNVDEGFPSYKLPSYKRWDLIGQEIGCSGKTVEREFRVLVERFLKTKATKGEVGATIKVVHVRGKRRLRYYRMHSLQFGEWSREWSELITDGKIIRELRRQGVPFIRSDKTPVLSSPVNQLFGKLIRHFGSDVPKSEQMLPVGMSAADWEFNVHWAGRVLSGKKHLTGPWTALEVARKLVRGAGLCGACRTFLIRGFRINGRRITPARKFCDNACKMRSQRRKKNSTR